jgi:hypothetical protein
VSTTRKEEAQDEGKTSVHAQKPTVRWKTACPVKRGFDRCSIWQEEPEARPSCQYVPAYVPGRFRIPAVANAQPASAGKALSRTLGVKPWGVVKQHYDEPWRFSGSKEEKWRCPLSARTGPQGSGMQSGHPAWHVSLPCAHTTKTVERIACDPLYVPLLRKRGADTLET